MSNLNWPEGATHYLDAGNQHTRFRDLSGENWKFFNALTGQWSQHYFSSEELLQRMDLIPRPQPKPWSGPEDGLPPIDSVCEFMWNYKREGSEYVKARVLHNDNGSMIVRILDGEGKGSLKENRGGDCGRHPIFRPIKTPNQIAAELRETAIRELMDIAQVDCRVTAARLVDAGFKREVV